MTTAVASAARCDPPAPPLLLAGSPPVRAGIVAVGGVGVGVATALQPWLGAVAVLAVAGTLAALAQPGTAAIVVSAVAPVTAGLQRGLVVPGLKVSEVLICWLAVVVLLACGPSWRARWSTLDLVFLTYVLATFGLGVLGMARNGTESSENLGEVLGPLQFLLLYRLVLVALRTEAERMRGLRVVLVSSVPVSLISLAQQFDVGPVRQLLISFTGSLQAPGTDDPWAVTERATGPFAHWFGLAGYLLVILLVAAALLLARSNRVLPTPVLLTVAGLTLLALMCTLTFAALGAAAAGVVALGWRHHRMGLVAAGMAGALLAGQALLADGFERRFAQQADSAVTDTGVADSLLPSTLEFRLDLWKDQLLPAAAEHAALGYGPGLPEGLSWGATESLYLTLVLRGGIPLLLIYLCLLVAMVQRAGRVATGPPGPDAVLGHALVVILLITSGMQLTCVLFTDAGFPHVLWALLALLGRPDDDAVAASVTSTLPKARP